LRIISIFLQLILVVLNKYPGMKRYIFILFSMLFAFSVNAQIKQEVIASAGGYNINGALSISWTLGETIIPTFTSQDGSLILTHGFQQKLIVTTVEENLDLLVNIKVFPNPASEVLNIQFEAPVEGEIVLSILDSQGRLVKRDIIESTMVEKQINLQDIPAGIYYLRMTKGKLVNVYKVVKL
jgi:hypothetical protein